MEDEKGWVLAPYFLAVAKTSQGPFPQPFSISRLQIKIRITRNRNKQQNLISQSSNYHINPQFSGYKRLYEY